MNFHSGLLRYRVDFQLMDINDTINGFDLEDY